MISFKKVSIDWFQLQLHTSLASLSKENARDIFNIGEVVRLNGLATDYLLDNET